MRTICGADASGDAVASFNAEGECGAQRGPTPSRTLHHGQIEAIDLLTGKREADETAPVFGHEVDLLGRDLFRRAHEVTFVLTVFIVDQDHHFARANVIDRGAHVVDEAWIRVDFRTQQLVGRGHKDRLYTLQRGVFRGHFGGRPAMRLTRVQPGANRLGVSDPRAPAIAPEEAHPLAEPSAEPLWSDEDSLPAPPVAPRIFQPRRAGPADVLRPTRAEISLGRLRHNLSILRRFSQARVWCVLKADGYGHGAKACARTLERAGADGVCVALIEEAIELRDAGVNLPILVMSGYFGSSRSELIHYRLTPVIHSPGQLEELEKEADYTGSSQVPYHVKIDTGMGRLGIPQRDLPRVVEVARASSRLHFEGLMTHFASADTDPESVARQLALFRDASETFTRSGLVPRVKHAANTAALLGFKGAHFDIVRPGLGVFGVQPTPGAAPDLRPVMRVLSTVIALRELDPGQTVGYGGSFAAERRSLIATLPIGYADGLGRQHSNRGHVIIRGRRAPIVGRVSMDLTTVDVTDLPGVALGDEAVILGEQQGALGQDVITAEEIADIEGTIPWEVLTSVSRRVPRFYRDV